VKIGSKVLFVSSYGYTAPTAGISQEVEQMRLGITFFIQRF